MAAARAVWQAQKNHGLHNNQRGRHAEHGHIFAHYAWRESDPPPPPQLIINVDETFLLFEPENPAKWMGHRSADASRVPVCSSKEGFTLTLAFAANWTLVGVRLIFKGKTACSIPKTIGAIVEGKVFLYFREQSHFRDTDTCPNFLRDCIVPYVNAYRMQLDNNSLVANLGVDKHGAHFSDERITPNLQGNEN